MNPLRLLFPRLHGIAVRATASAIRRAIRATRQAALEGPSCQTSATLTLRGPLHLWIPHHYHITISAAGVLHVHASAP